MNRKATICVITLLLLNAISLKNFAQDKHAIHKISRHAQVAFEKLDYLSAYNQYLEVIKLDSSNMEAYYKAGLCLFNLNRKDTISLALLSKARNHISETHFYIGRIYLLEDLCEKALEEFYYFKKVNTEAEITNKDLNHWIDVTELAIKEEHNKKYYVIKNLSDKINSKYSEYVPLYWKEKNSMIFTSRRPTEQNKLVDAYGNFYEDIYISKKNGDDWALPTPISDSINTNNHDACVALSFDEKELIIYRTDAHQTGGDLYSCIFNGTTWSSPKLLPKGINSDYLEASLCFSKSGHELYFSSNRPRGYGGKDIYKVTKFDNNTYSHPVNLGPTINTEEDDDAPFLDDDNSTLYFSSKGHHGMGAYDIFKSVFDDETHTWMKAENLGAPINSTTDDIYFIKLPDENRAYFTSRRGGGKGDADIYEINFNESEQLIIHGKLINENSKSSLDLSNAHISYFDEKDELLGQCKPNKKMSTFVFTAIKGKKYKIVVRCDNMYTETIFKEFDEKNKDLEIKIRDQL